MQTQCSLVRQISSALLLSATAVLAQGPLTPPPGLPAPSMKSLTQIEPRIEISAANTPGDAASVFRITQPGSYYLSGNFTALPGMNGLNVQSSDVRIDLNGFTVIGGHNSAGILIEAGSSRVEIHNGGVRSFASGVSGTADSIRVRNVTIGACTTGILLGAGATVEHCTVSDSQTGISIAGGRVSRCTVRHVRDGIAITGMTEAGTVEDCTVQAVDSPTTAGKGIAVPEAEGAVISRCSVRGFGGSGIFANGAAAISGCTAVGNGQISGTGIAAGYGSSITNCSAKSNGGTGISGGAGSTIENCAAKSNGSGGIHAGDNSVVKNCSAHANQNTGIDAGSFSSVLGCISNANGSGISVYIDAFVQGCSVNYNTNNGIHVQTSSVVKDNNVNHNGIGTANGAGIHANYGGNRIENNNVLANNFGLYLELGGNVVIRNTIKSSQGPGPDPAPDYRLEGGSNILGTIVINSAGLNNANNNGSANFR